MLTITPEQMGPHNTDWQAESHAVPGRVGLTSQSLILFLSKSERILAAGGLTESSGQI